jgi:hypothetical protein
MSRSHNSASQATIIEFFKLLFRGEVCGGHRAGEAMIWKIVETKVEAEVVSAGCTSASAAF